LGIPARDRLIFALDFATQAEAMAIVEELGDAVSFYKIGLQLFLAPDGNYATLADFLARNGKKTMIDLKMLDVPQTVANAVAQLRHFNATFATVHAQDETMLRAAVAQKNETRILAVTVLTSINESDLRAQGFPDSVSVEDLVLDRARRAVELGCDGVVASGREASALRAQHRAADMIIVTPGIRAAASEGSDDQKRTMDVEEAFESGADYIVVGRPIRDAADPNAAARAIQGRIAALFGA
jgi:orotidine-5'-phosphate decarboxylase